MISEDQFLQALRQAGFAQVTTVEREPGGSLDEHTHPFEARALILSGEISIGTQGETRLYRAGDVFHLAQGQPHTEAYGPAGVKYLVGRK